MKVGKWLSYNELAWTEQILSPPDKMVGEVELYCRAIMENSAIEPVTLLHLGSGAGVYDFTFKKYFTVTGVDISEGMLEMARHLNPEVDYHQGDMRYIEMGKLFDAVVIPESIAYMATTDDLRRAVFNAYQHLNPGGVLLIVALLREEFRDTNFAYSGSSADLQVTVFENNYLPDPKGSIYEATMIYLIRRGGELEIYSDQHVLGLFDLAEWLDIFQKIRVDLRQIKLDDLYDSYILGDGEYCLRMFVGRKV
ncbi:MAG: class I SAM-dependent methyltransferase [Bacillota bacterium]|nr:class I SAM-dependent methyltransferase [Bacillota bacterium]